MNGFYTMRIFFCLFVSFAVLSTARETKCYPHKEVVVGEIGAGYASGPNGILGNFYKEYWPFTCEDGTELTVKIDEIDETIIGGRKKEFLMKEKYLGKLQKKFKKRVEEKRDSLGVVLGHFVDDSDDRKYGTTKIGSQVWMSENLKKGPWKTVSFSWDEALNACPDGWHLPSRADFEILLVETERIYHLSAENDWKKQTKGDDLYGFSAKPNIVKAGEERAAFWSSSPVDSNSDFAYQMFISSRTIKEKYSKGVQFGMDAQFNIIEGPIAPMRKNEKLAVRCVQNNEYAYTIGTLVDSRDGQSYKTVTLGNQTWMAENLNYEHSSGYCYEKNPHNCIKYGRIYKGYGGWGISKYDLCPKGWKIPSVEDFNSLFAFVGGKKIAGAVLKSKSGWPNDGNGLDAYGFSILPAGCVSSVTSNNGDETSFWTSGKTGFGDVITVGFSRNPGIGGCEHSFSDNGFSVRCIRESHDNFADNNRQGSETAAKSVSGNLDLDTVSSQYDSFVDPRDGKSYRIMSFDLSYNIQSNYDSKGEKQINETRTRQTWFAENLNYSTGTSDDKCFNDKHYNCKKYGRFYKWGAAQYACPDGFHLPTESDIRVFQSNVFKNTVKNDAWREYYWLSNGKTYPYQDYSRKKEFNLVRCVKDAE